MKKLHWFLPAILCLAIACDHGSNTKHFTVINPDGSCYKLIEANSDSAFIVGDTAKSNPFNITLDSTWEVSWSYITPEYQTNWPLQSWTWDTAHKHETLNVRAKRNYASVEDMAKNFRLAPGQHTWSNLIPEYYFGKKFRWFYTYYTYREKYPKIKTLDRIPLERYLSQKESEFWFNGNLEMIQGLNGIEIKELTEKIDGNFNKWFSHNILDEQHHYLVEHYGEITGAPDKGMFIAMKDSLIHLCLNDGNKETKEAIIAEIADKLFKTKAFSAFNYQNKTNKMKELEEEILQRFFTYFTDKLNYHLILPGKVLKADKAIVSGDTIAFNLTAERLVYSDYEIGATSRKANTWAFVLTGIIVLLAVGSMFVRRR